MLPVQYLLPLLEWSSSHSRAPYSNTESIELVSKVESVGPVFTFCSQYYYDLLVCIYHVSESDEIYCFTVCAFTVFACL